MPAQIYNLVMVGITRQMHKMQSKEGIDLKKVQIKNNLDTQRGRDREKKNKFVAAIKLLK